MKLKNRLSGVQVSVPDELGEELLGKGTYQTPADYDDDQRERAAVERDRLATLAGAEPDDDEKPAKETAAQRRKREKEEAEAAAEAERVKAEQEAAAAAAGNGS